MLLLPQMLLELHVATSVLGMTAAKHVKGRYCALTFAVCNQCGCTQIFTLNAPQLTQWVPGSTTITVPPR